MTAASKGAPETTLTKAPFASLVAPPLSSVRRWKVAEYERRIRTYGQVVPIQVTFDLVVADPELYLALRRLVQKGYLNPKQELLVSRGRHLNQVGDN